MKTLSHKVQVFLLACLTFIATLNLYKLSQTSVPETLSLESQFNQFTDETKQEIYCLADNIYFEAAGEPKVGKYAVAFVTQNRVNKGFAPDICSVVKQKINGVCQFSWWCESKSRKISTSKVLTNAQNEVYNDVLKIAINFYINREQLEDPTEGALFYHANYINPNWRFAKKRIVIGNHIFYVDTKGKKI